MRLGTTNTAMKCIIYLSLAKFDFTNDQLIELAKQSSNKNLAHQITGFLCYQNGRFIQYIEGEADALEQLMAKIKEDDRHKILVEIASEEACEKRFPIWGMTLLKEEQLTDFNFEDSIERNLLYIKNEFLHQEMCKDIVWRHVNLIAQLHLSKLTLQDESE